eukprot:scaffold23103_cov76-Skeletonema_dohrnii-CCMP3373.AAC.1
MTGNSISPLPQTCSSATQLQRACEREIRYGRQQRSLRPSQMPHQVTYDVVATPIRPTNA